MSLPVHVREARAGMLTFLVDAHAAQALLPGPELTVIEVWPGRTPLALGCIDYLDNDLGDYLEVSVVLFVRPTGASRGVPYLSDAVRLLRGRLGTYIHALPVDQQFTCDAGRTIWGFPKTVERIEFDRREDTATCRLIMAGQHAFTLQFPVGGRRRLPGQEITTYTYIGGVLHRTRATQAGRGVGVRLRRGGVDLGDHVLADELRALGLPRRPVSALWFGHFEGSFGAPVQVDSG